MGRYDFDFARYDQGGLYAVKGDGKLTGAEVIIAKRDGFENVWEGFTPKDKAPINIYKAEAEEKARKIAQRNAFCFEEYDKGGKNATAGDGKLTGEEVLRAEAAGYKNIPEGMKKKDSSKVGLRDEVGTLFGAISRTVAQKSTSSGLRRAAAILDVLLFPISGPNLIFHKYQKERFN